MKINNTNIRRCKHFSLKIRILFTILLVLSVSAGYPAFAQQPKFGNETVRMYWSEMENILVFHPEFVRHLFFGVVDLKGNRVVSRSKINQEILDCRMNTTQVSNCWIERLKSERNERKISSFFRSPVIIQQAYLKDYPRDKSKSIVKFIWNRPVFQPPTCDVDVFFDNLGVANDSPLYAQKPNINEITLNPVIQNEIEILINKTTAQNLVSLYQKAPADYNDSVTFKYDSYDLNESGDIAVFDFHLKAVKISVNHQTYIVNPESFL